MTQIGLVALVSGVFYLRTGSAAAAAVWFGGMIATANVALLLWRRDRAGAGRTLTARQSLLVLYRTAVERFVLVAALLATGLGILKLDPLAVLSGFAVGQLALLLMHVKGKSANHVV